MFEANKTNIVFKQKLYAYDVANKRFQESLIKRTTQLREQSEIDEIVKQLPVFE